MSGSFLGSKIKSVRFSIARTFAVVAGVAAVSLLPGRVWAQGGLQDTPAAPVQASAGSQALCEPQVINNRRIPKDSILARLSSHQGDPYDPETVERDFNSLWNTGYFENLSIEKVDTPECVQLVVIVREKPTIDPSSLNVPMMER